MIIGAICQMKHLELCLVCRILNKESFLGILRKKGLVIFKFGQAKARYFQIVSLKKQTGIDNLVKKLKVIEEKDIDRILTSINEVLNDI